MSPRHVIFTRYCLTQPISKLPGWEALKLQFLAWTLSTIQLCNTTVPTARVWHFFFNPLDKSGNHGSQIRLPKSNIYLEISTRNGYIVSVVTCTNGNRLRTQSNMVTIFLKLLSLCCGSGISDHDEFTMATDNTMVCMKLYKTFYHLTHWG